MKFNIDPNWLLILKNAWSMRFAALSTLSAIAAAMMPVFDKSSTEFAVLSAVLAVCGALSRVVVQPVLRAQLEQADESVGNLKD